MSDVTGINIDRFQPYQCNPEYRRQRALESLGLVYACHYPTRSMQTARGARKSPFHDRLAAQGAHFRDVSGWESPGWYAPDGQEPVADRLTWGRPNWFPWWAAEHRACREGVILMDMSFMGKFLVQGRDAGAFLDYLSANEVNGEAGKITYTQWLNEDGRLEADLTVIKIDDEKFMVVTSDIAHRHTETWMKTAYPRRAACLRHRCDRRLRPAEYPGPEIAGTAAVADFSADLSNEAFPFRAVREIDIGLARVICVRITYVGELGYELNIPSEQATHVYDRIVAAGKKFGLVHAGLKALGSLRLEKGYRDYGHDIDNMDDPYRGGLGFCGQAGQGWRFHRQAGLPAKEGGGSVPQTPGAGAGQGPATADVPRRSRAAQRHPGRAMSALRPTAIPWAAPSAWRWSRAIRWMRPGCNRVSGKWISPGKGIRLKCHCGRFMTRRWSASRRKVYDSGCGIAFHASSSPTFASMGSQRGS